MCARAGTAPRTAPPLSEDGRRDRTDTPGARGSGGVAVTRRMWLAAATAMVAFLAAASAALVSPSESRGVYRWPASQAADAPVATDRPLFAPLLLARHAAARVSVDVPCAHVPAPSAAGGRFTVAATANDPPTANGLWLAVDGPDLQMGVGSAVLAGLPWPAPAVADGGCTVVAGFEGRAWRLDVGGEEIGRGTRTAPVVTGLFTDLPRPIEGRPGLSVEVVTAVTGTSPSFGQVAFTIVAIGAAALALVLLLARPRRRRVAEQPSLRWRGLWRRLAWIDALVVGALVAWWIVGPVLYDDGWVLATVQNFARSGTFSNYYDVFDAQYPLGFVQFVFHFATSRLSTSVLWMRLPVVLIGIATWALLRTYLAGLGAASRRASRAALASMFLLFWFAWLSTLRPEPIIVLLSAIAIVAVERFSRRAALDSLVVAVAAATIALSIHPEGIVVLAPLLVALPAVWRWLRDAPRARTHALVALGLVAAACLVLLVTADSNLALWRENRRLFAANNLNALSWRDEFFRYETLFDTNTIWGPVVRRATVLFASSAVVLFVTRRSGRREAAYNLPVLSLVVAGILMALTPSKWPWQLGALAAFAALAVATEVAVLARQPVGSASRTWRSVVVLAAAVGASVVAWRGGADFGDFAVVNVHFGRGGSGLLGVDLGSPVPSLVLAGVVLVVAVAAAARAPRRAARPTHARWLASSGAWAVPVAVGVVVAATFALFASDAVAQGSAWSLPRQQYDDLVGRTCGMADDVAVADAARGTPLTALPQAPEPLPAGVAAAARGRRLEGTAGAAPPAPAGIDLGDTWGSAIGGDGVTGTVASPWFAVRPDAARTTVDGQGLALFTAGTLTGGNRLYAQFGRAEGSMVAPIGVARVDASDSGASWRPAALDPPRGADRVRLIAVDATTATDGWLAFSAPRRVRYHPLDRVLTRDGTRALVGPAVRMYFPCAVGPVIAAGVAQVPQYTVTGRTDRAAGLWAQSPTANLVDLYSVRPLLVRGAPGPSPDGLAIDRIVGRPLLHVRTPFRS